MPANTPNLNLPYPVPGDTVDVPRDVSALANALDGLPTAPAIVLPGGSFPVSPVNGQLVDYVDVVKNVYWRFRWLNVSGAQKWMFAGGAPMQSNNNTGAEPDPTGTVWLDHATLRLTLPLPGLYRFETVLKFTANSGANPNYAGIGFVPFASGSDPAWLTQLPTGDIGSRSLVYTMGASANDGVGVRLRMGNAANSYGLQAGSRFEALPIRLGP